jgi:predicted small lipoprotein YifL
MCAMYAMYAECKAGRLPACIAAVLLAVLVGVGLAGCGQKGDLYLPSKDEKSDSNSKR